MRKPALLLHDQTITPSSHEKEAISEWLPLHEPLGCPEPKTPGRQLTLKTVELVYNEDLAPAMQA